jgi:peptidoglycan/LPS O-acetylase OafA/YrhL
VSLLSISFFQFQHKDLNLPQHYFFTKIWFGWCFGAWICDKFVNDREFLLSKKWKYMAAVIILLFISSQLFTWRNDSLIKYNINIIIWSLIVVWFILNENIFIKYKNWLLIPLAVGASSYSLYLLHQPLIELKNYIIHYYFKSSPNYIYPLMIIGVFVVPFVCYLNYKIIELPFIKYKKNGK